MFSYLCPIYIATTTAQPAAPTKPAEPATPSTLQPKPTPPSTQELVIFTLGMAR